MPSRNSGEARRELRIAAAGDIHCREANRDRIRIGDVPVLNVSVYVTGRDFRIVDLKAGDAHTPIP